MAIPPIETRYFYKALAAGSTVCMAAGAWMWGSCTGDETLKAYSLRITVITAVATGILTGYCIHQMVNHK